jgi:hypothetical protein
MHQTAGESNIGPACCNSHSKQSVSGPLARELKQSDVESRFAFDEVLTFSALS